MFPVLRLATLGRRLTRLRPSAALGSGGVRSLSTIPFLLADIGEGIAEVEVLQWYVEKGDKIHQFDKVCEVQSDKATVEISSRYDGVVEAVHHEVGDMVAVGSPLIDIAVEGESEPDANTQATQQPGQSTSPVSESHSPSASSTTQKSSSSIDKVLTTPAVRKLAKENSIDLSLVVPSGPGGRILKADVLAYLQGQPSDSPRDEPPVSKEPTTLAPQPVQRRTEEKRERIQGIRRIMVKSMQASLSIPHFTYSDEIEVDNLALVRAELNEALHTSSVRLSFLPFLLKAASVALEEAPLLNSSISADESEIIFHASHNIGIAMDTPRGLLVPCIKGVESMSIIEIGQAISELQQIGAEGKLTEEHLTGGTFTISNLGSIGGTYMTPVLTVPQVAIGALGRIRTVPKYGDNDELVPARTMTVSWSGDHRVIDGATMARFSNHFKVLVEKPTTLLAHLR